MQHRTLSTLLSVAVLTAAGGGLLAWLSREQQEGRAARSRSSTQDRAPDDADMERLLEKFAAALPKDEAEWMLRRGREQLETRH